MRGGFNRLFFLLLGTPDFPISPPPSSFLLAAPREPLSSPAAFFLASGATPPSKKKKKGENPAAPLPPKDQEDLWDLQSLSGGLFPNPRAPGRETQRLLNAFSPSFPPPPPRNQTLKTRENPGVYRLIQVRYPSLNQFRAFGKLYILGIH